MSKIKIAMGIEYNGNSYHGWQYQTSVPNIQEKVEFAISTIANHSVKVQCAGRTDAGVHSTGQVIHFYTNSIRKDHSWIVGVNRYLPKDISVVWKREVSQNFHARYSALSRRYRYVIYNSNYRSSIFYQGVNFFHKKLDIKKMKKAASHLIGKHDFTTFRAKNCQSSTPIRTILYLDVFSANCLVVIDIIANSFLYHMVRNIVGALLEVGISNKSHIWIKDILELKDRTLSTVVVKPNGLYLVKVEYDLHFDLPNIPIGPFFIQTFL